MRTNSGATAVISSGQKSVFHLALTAYAVLIFAQARVITAQVSSRRIVFDVVSVKPNHTLIGHPGPMVISDGFDVENATPIWVMYWAFDCGTDRDERHFSELPGWAKTERFDIIAEVADADVATWERLPDSEKERMVRDVLADRFKMSFHTESHEQPIYALSIAKDGLKVVPVAAQDSDYWYGKDGYVGPDPGGVVGKHATIKSLTEFLNKQQLGRVVVDRTGLTGNYDFILKFTPLPVGNFADDAPDLPGSTNPYIFTALQKQLGLKLQPTRGPVDTIVIDHIERPSAN